MLTRPSLIALTPVPKKPSTFSLRVNLGPHSQLLEAIEPHLSMHHSTSIQADISIYELIAVTRQVFSRSSSDGVLEDAAGGAGRVGRRASLRRSLSAAAGKRSSFLEVPHEYDKRGAHDSEGGRLAVPGSSPPPGGSSSLANVSRFSSSSTLVSSSSDVSGDVSPLGFENSKLRNWLCTRKDRSSILVRRVTKRIGRARSARRVRRADAAAAAGDDKTTLTTTNLLKLDAGRWERDGSTDADADALTDIGRSAMSATSSTASDDASLSGSEREGSVRVTSAASSWASSVSLGSQMSEAVSVAKGEKMAEGGSVKAALACAAQVSFAGTVR